MLQSLSCTNVSWTSAVSVPLQRQPQHPAFRVSPLEFFERQMRAVDDRLAQSECGLYESEVYQDMQQRFKEPKINKFLEHTRTVHSTAGRQYQKLKTAAQPATAGPSPRRRPRLPAAVTYTAAPGLAELKSRARDSESDRRGSSPSPRPG